MCNCNAEEIFMALYLVQAHGISTIPLSFRSSRAFTPHEDITELIFGKSNRFKGYLSQ